MKNRNITRLATQAYRAISKTEGGPSAEAIAASVAALLQKNNNDPNRAIETLLADNAKLREDKRKLKEDVEGKDRLIQAYRDDEPEDGAVILTADEGKIFQQLVGEKGTIKDLAEKIAKSGELEQKVAAQERKQTIDQAAKALGFKPAVLEKLADGLEIELKTVPKTDPKTGGIVDSIVPFVKQESGAKPLLDFATESWKEFMPSLQEKTDAGTPFGGAPGVQYPASGGSGGASEPDNVVDKFIKQTSEARAKGTNPLLPAGA
jgi:hypothetical protein